MNRRSIQVRMTFWATILVILTSVGSRVQTYYSIEHSLYGDLRGRLTRRVVDIREQILPHINEMSADKLSYKITDDYLTKDTSSFIRIRREDGKVLFLTDPPFDRSYDPESIPFVDYSDEIKEFYISTHPEHHIFLISLRASANGVNYVLELGHPSDQIDQVLHNLTISLILGLPFIMVIAIAGGLFWIRKALQPIEAMRVTAEQISSGNLRQRLPVPTSDDPIEHLAKTVNQMLGRLDQSYQQASRFSADAAHELRTPVTIIRGEIETLARDEGSEAIRERAGSMLEEIERLSNIVDSLISLSRLDAGGSKAYKPVDLSHLVRTTLEQIQLLAEEKNILVTIEAEQPFFILGDVEALKQVIINLFDNAVKYTMKGGSVVVSVHTTDKTTVLTFKDNGSGIATGEIPHIFERFYRTENARAQSIQGAGLGLSIVQSICQAHEGTIKVTSQEGVGTVFTVEFPRFNDEGVTGR